MNYSIFPKSEHAPRISHNTANCCLWNQLLAKSKPFTGHHCHTGLNHHYFQWAVTTRSVLWSIWKSLSTSGKRAAHDGDSGGEQQWMNDVASKGALLRRTLRRYLQPPYNRAEVGLTEFEQLQTFFFCHCKGKKKRKKGKSSLVCMTGPMPYD